MFNIAALPVLTDNYIWVLHEVGNAIVIDPGEARTVLTYLQQTELQLSGILITHHHHDHIDGVAQLVAAYPVPVYGPADIAVVTSPLSDHDLFRLPGLPYSAQVLAVPGHTLDHIAYLIEDRLFCGDTLFACGCGRVFEGTAPMMYQSLQRLAALPDHTYVYCAHEYTLANEAFAIQVEPGNQALLRRIEDDRHRRQQGQPTLPSTIALEKATNPFLRANDADEFAKRRAAKELFSTVL